VLADDPSLKLKKRYASGQDPLRVVLDTQGRTPPDARVLEAGPTLVVHGPGASPPAGAEHAEVPLVEGRLDIAAVLGVLHARGIESVLVEGGGQVIRSFLDSGLVDVFTLYQAPWLVGGGPRLWPGPVAAPRKLRVVSRELLGEGVLWTFKP
jgi:diaminohydroxyphosphoribosylaminopyrimidine deaminase / 5-amino-6-(5-phosphoribosylamino)uracil reductase